MADNTVEIVIKGTDRASGAIGGVKRALGGLGNSVQSIGRDMVALGGKVSALSMPLGMLGAKALGVAGDFEAAMNVLTMAARSSGTAIEDLSAAAIAVGADVELVGIDASQAADAMTTFYKAGLSTSDIFVDLQGYLAGTTPLVGALRTAIDLAAASDLDLAAASDAVATAMATFGLPAEEATRIANSFVGAADASVAEVSDLAEALKNVGPTMAQFGYSLEDTNAALAILSTRGITGAEAGTALKSMMTNLMRPTKKVQELLGELNISLYDQSGVLKPLPTIIEELGNAMAGLTEEERNVAIQTLAGTYGMKAMATLLAEGRGGWEAMTQAIANAATAQDVASARTKGFNAAMEQLQGAIETFMITAATPLMQNVLTPLIQRLQGVIEALIAADPQLLNLGVIIAGVAAAAGPLLIALGAITTAFGMLLSPIGLVIAAITLLAVAWAANFGGIRDFTLQAWEAIRSAIQTAIDFIRPYIEDLVFTVRNWFEEHWPQIQAIFETVWGAIQTAIETVVPLVTGLIRDEFGVIIGWVQENWPLIKETITTILDAILDAVETVVGFITQFWSDHHDTILSVASSIWGIVQSTIDTIIHTILDILRAVMQLITGDWEGAWETVQGTARRIWEWMQTVWEETLKAIRSILDAILPKLQDFWEETWAAIKDKVEEIWDNIQDKVKSVTEEIDDKIRRAFGAIRTFWEETWAAIRDALRDVWNSMWNKLVEKIREIDGKIRRAFGTIRTFWRETWTAIHDALVEAFKKMVRKAGEFGGNIIRSMKEAMGNIKIPVPTFSIEWRTGPLGIKVPDLKIGVDWKALRDVVAWLAKGGIVTRPTLAVLGESGPEAVVPLSGAGGRHGAAGLGFDSRAVTLLTEIRNLLADSAGVDQSRFAYSDMMWDLRAARA